MHPFTLSVPNMSCSHCRASIETALAPLGAVLGFDMPAREVTVKSGPAPEQVQTALSAIGFSAQAR